MSITSEELVENQNKRYVEQLEFFFLVTGFPIQHYSLNGFPTEKLAEYSKRFKEISERFEKEIKNRESVYNGN